MAGRADGSPACADRGKATGIAAVGMLISSLGVPPAAANDRELGEYLSAECVTCHHVNGQYSGIPPIVGWPADAFIFILNEYRDKTRPNPIMQTIASRFSSEEIAALAAYFGSLPQQQNK